MNHSELVTAIAARIASRGLSKADISAVIEALGEEGQHTLSAGGEITLKGLGKLKATTRAARSGHNPATGEKVQIPAKAAAKFAASKELKTVLNDE